MKHQLKDQYQKLFDNPELTNEQKLSLILKETIKHFNTSNRCIQGSGACLYSPKSVDLEGKSEGCAVGRLFEAKTQEYLDAKFSHQVWSGISSDDRDNAHPFMVQNVNFFDALQRLHDQRNNWDGKGLTEQGLLRVNTEFGYLTLVL